MQYQYSIVSRHKFCHSYITWHSIFLSSLLILLCLSFQASADSYKVGIRANRGIDHAIEKWQATINHLNQEIQGHDFSLITYTNNSTLNQALSRADFDFVLTNSASHVEHVDRYGVRPIATLINKRGKEAVSQYGSVIFCRADRSDIKSLQDLKTKAFMGVDELGFGGWRAAWYELHKHKINPYQDFSTLSFAGGKQQRVVEAVLNGSVDAGSIRTDLLESLAAKGKINLHNIRVLNKKKSTHFPFLHSTSLYPEWPFAVLAHVPENITQQVTEVLENIKSTDTAAIQGKYIGWAAPLDYYSVDHLLKTLLIGHYKYNHNEFIYIIQQHWVLAIIILSFILVAAYVSIYTTRLNKKLATTQHYLVDEIQTRKTAEQILHHLALNAIRGQTEEDFLKRCVTDLANFYNTKYAFIGIFESNAKTHITTKAVWAHDKFADNFTYELRGTPCQDVLNQNIEIIHTAAAERYPDDEMLINMGIDSYYGAPIITHEGTMLGLISVMDTSAINPSNWARDVLGVFANRIALELDRLSAERQLQETATELSYLASHDSLTGLINRREFERRLKHAIEDARIEHKTHVCCYLDLDQFKIVNDTSGHIAGDELLKQLSKKLEEYVRSSDTLARLGGDEFGILLFDCPKEKAIKIADEILNVVNQFHFSWQDKVFNIGVSIGLVMIDLHSESIEKIFADADSACYIAKEKGRNRIHVFEVEDEDHVLRAGQLQWASRITSYLNDNRFFLYRQDIKPSNNLQTNNEQFEILLRYTDDEGNVKTPQDLIIAAERYGLMGSVDRWVFDSSCRYLRDQYTGTQNSSNIICHINISGLSMLDEDFQGFIESKISEYQLPHNIFCFEITETAAISNLTIATRFIKLFKNRGVRFALDDFGSGMSSFSYLKNLPVDYLKIDGHIVRDASRDKINHTMLKSIHDIGAAMNIKTIAESVETESLLNISNEIGIDLVQGYYLDKPHPIAE